MSNQSKKAELKIVDASAETAVERNRQKLEDSWKLTREEIVSRVKSLRRGLEAARDRYDACIFDSLATDVPVAVRLGERGKASV